ncbi:hypothetical protein Rhopal_003499-T1 [Rhodotorula paludigena]|uniref:Uncharacterized protein n=1 Tax=Rhodotorula paludigena TaxID=86838 RepID=A0AAV5GP80_9BASI|nr:hypothetical protein Rhopal_003499-T1 [Rhodotorula paludigena]
MGGATPPEPVHTAAAPLPPTPPHKSASRRLPPELVSLVLEHTHDWELARALGVRTALPVPAPWLEFATPLDWAILRAASTRSLVPLRYARAHGDALLTQWGARAMLRLSLVDQLDLLFRADPRHFRAQCEHLLPVVASAWGRRAVLEWAKDSPLRLRPDAKTTAEAIDEASRHGQVEMLDFWLESGLPLHYSDAALDSATFKRQLGTLEWWKNSGLPLKIGYVLDFASMEGTTVCLDWWAKSGLPVRYSRTALYTLSKSGNIALLNWWKNSSYSLLYDKEVLVIATQYGQVAALQWWADSGLDIEYRFFDIEEALEDSVANKEETQKWWEARGYDPALSTNAWMKVRNLNDEVAGGVKPH